jgi:phosphoribosyl-ATP pyrophosphohydrolase
MARSYDEQRKRRERMEDEAKRMAEYYTAKLSAEGISACLKRVHEENLQLYRMVRRNLRELGYKLGSEWPK